MSPPTATARLDGSVQGVVVQMSIDSGPGSPSTGRRRTATVRAGSCRGRVASSRRISKFDSGVSAPHEYGMTRYALYTRPLSHSRLNAQMTLSM